MTVENPTALAAAAFAVFVIVLSVAFAIFLAATV